MKQHLVFALVLDTKVLNEWFRGNKHIEINVIWFYPTFGHHTCKYVASYYALVSGCGVQARHGGIGSHLKYDGRNPAPPSSDG